MIEDREDRDVDEATARPWTAMTTGSEGCSIVGGGRWRVARLTHAPLSRCQADAALIVEAVNAYDRLRAIEAAARAYFDAEWGPTERYQRAKDNLHAMVSEVPSDAR